MRTDRCELGELRGGIRKEGDNYIPCSLDTSHGFVDKLRAVLPHYQELAGGVLDGLRLIEDIAVSDSYMYPFYALPDGSYVYIEDGKAEFCGPCYYFNNGTIRPVKKRDSMC